ncbi:MAG: carboxypeptidase regulatory-like domain-containing protein [Bacteroidales bacterium]|nr:carboxypeptidase regulatory-like domain-containing protein [Bacteroidales bacterium]
MKNTIHNMKKLMVCLMLFASWQMVQAQVTTGSMAGVVRSGSGETLPGATILATHEPTGTTYGVTTSVTGNYNIQGMRVGGPYKVQISFMGYQPQSIENITISLGDPLNLNVTLTDAAMTLEGVTIVGDKVSAFSQERTGAVTNISNLEMTRMPTLSRNLTDVARLSPYSTGSASFVGRESFATNITVDGANFNNNFGLSGGGMPGTSGEPISMDAIEELQVVVAPYDVRQSNFTGAGINAVTKSGTNTVKGSAYGYFRNQNMGGKKIRGNEISNIPESSRAVYGFSVGAPIIKNKLFIFLNGEIDSETRPGNTLLAAAPGRDPDDPNVSTTVQASDLQEFSSFLKEKFNYETGRYESWGGDDISNNKMLARIDWNAHKDHKVSFRYNFSKSSNLSRPSSSNDAGGAISPSRHSRTGGMSFENSQYRNDGIMHSLTGELHSRFGNNLSNNLLIAYTNYDQPRSTTSTPFPMVDIMRGDIAGTNSYMTAGYELFSWQNRVQNNTLIITNNATYQKDQHTITGGLSFEHQYFANSYLRNGTAYYRYKDLNAFKNHANNVASPDGNWHEDYHPLGFAYTYPINGFTKPVAELSFGQFAAYVQDEWAVRDNLKLTIGMRVDLPMYFDGAIDNPGLHGQTFRDGQTVDLSTWPDAKLLWSPRLGFNWDVHKDRSLTVRGGTGIFTGRIPFVWFTNQPTNSGMLQFQYSQWHSAAGNQATLARIPFEADATALLRNPAIADIFPQQNAIRGGRVAVIDKDFKLPQVWRTSLASDIRLPLNMMLTLEAMYTKDVHAITFDNINIQAPDGTLIEGSNHRDYYTNNRQYINTDVNSDVIIMKNTKEGQGFSFSTQLRLPNWNGLSGDLSYTYTYSDEVAARTNGSDPISAWGNRQSINGLNATELGLSLMNTPHRIMASINYHIEYAKHFATTISLFYSGRTGNAFTYTYNGRPTNYTTTGTYIAYLPKNKDEVIWQTDADWDAYQEFVKQNPSIEKHLGDYAPKYGSYLPWSNRIDLRIAQEFRIKVGNVTNKLEFSADIINFANMLSSKWGIQDNLNGSFAGFPILSYRGRDAATGKAILAMNGSGSGENFRHFTSPTVAPGTVSATWAIQLGLRYTF